MVDPLHGNRRSMASTRDDNETITVMLYDCDSMTLLLWVNAMNYACEDSDRYSMTFLASIMRRLLQWGMR